jgi:diguanylate cyclase (GGDEF)-like protein/PAS domain S-box-containing protein
MKIPFAGKPDEQAGRGEVKRLVIWGITLSVITLSLLGAGVYFLYNASYERQARQLQDAVSNKAALIQSVARFDRENLPDTSDFANPGGQGPKAATFQQINQAFSRNAGLGETGEFVLGARRGDEVLILTHQREQKPKPHTHRYPLDSDGVAEPMRAALNGASGVVRGKDLHGNVVLAAVQPLPGVDWGLVAKKDLAEIRAPYSQAAGMAGLGALLLIGFGGLGFRRAVAPMINGLHESRSHYNRLLHMAGQGILYMDHEDRVSLANCKAREILGVYEPVDGRPLLELLPDEIHALIREKLRNIRAGTADEFEITATFSGVRRHLTITATPLFDPAGRYEGVLALFSDVTDTRDMQQSLLHERQLLRSVLDALPVGVWAVDADGDLVVTSRAGEEIWRGLCYEGAETAGEEHKAWWPDTGTRIQPEEEAVWRALQHGESVHNEVIDIESFDGSHKTVLNSAVPMFHADGGIRGAIIINEDITHRRNTERLMQRNEQLLQRVVQNLPEGVAVCDDRGTYIMTNESDATIWGFDRLGQGPNAFPGVAYRDREEYQVPDDDWPVHRVLQTGEPIEGDVFEVIRRSDGDRRWLSCSAAPVFDNHEGIWGVVELVQDITRRRRHQAEMRKLSDAVHHAADAILVLDTQGRVEFCNPAFTDITGYKLDDVLGQRPVEFLHHDTDAVTAFKRMRTLGEVGESDREVVSNRDKKGGLFQWDCTVSPVFNQDGHVVNYVITATDLSEQTRMHEELYRATRYDALTGLPNRDRMHEDIEHAVAAAMRGTHVVGLIKIDIDGFTLINEKHGHALGDKVLQAIGQRLVEVVGQDNVVGRAAADSFGVILTSTFAEEDVAAMVDAITRAFEEPVNVEDIEVPCKLNMGITIAPADGTDAETLVRHADVALTHAREEGLTARFYAEQLGEQARRRLTLEVALKEAIQQEQFELHFQPQIDLGSGRMRGLETLIRWEHPELGMISPGEFIPLAEKTGLIAQLSPWVLRQALLQRAAWRREGLEPGRVAVNLSARDFDDPELTERVRRTLEETGQPAEGLEIEITETMLMEKGAIQVERLRELSDMGITISVDDFGTGYSSLAYLSVLPIALLKIDRSFINQVEQEEDNNATIVRSIISMARSLDLEVVAEGVETQWQLEFLRRLRCDMAQGFFLARPSDVVTVTEMLKRDSWLSA